MPSLSELKAAGDVPPRSEKLSTKGKEALALAKVPFSVIAINHNPSGDNGPYWTVTAEFDLTGISPKELDKLSSEITIPDNGLLVTQFDLQGHASRDPQMSALTALSTQEPVTGCVLRKLTERMGNAFLVIDSADE